jgi:hypothetical protein
MTNKNFRLLTFGLVLTLLGSTTIAGSSAQTTAMRKCKQVAVKLDSKDTTQSEIEQQIRQQLETCGISATEKEIQSGAKDSLNLVSKSKDPQKGVIYVKTKKFTICASWGRDKEFCDKH